MADTFFGFNTALTDSLDDELHDEPDHGLEDEDEERYDALNDETFGADAVEEDWEEDHEKLVAESSRQRHSSYNNGSNVEEDDNADLDLEATITHLVLDDFDDPILENGEIAKHEAIPHLSSRPFPTSNCDLGLIDPTSYSSSAPSGFPVWGVAKPDTHQTSKPSSQSILPPIKKVCTVEELERDLISQRNAAAAAKTPGQNKTPGMRLEDVQRDLTTSNSSSFPVVSLGLGRGQPQPGSFPHKDGVAVQNTQNSAALNSIGRGSGVGHFPTSLAGPAPQPVLGLGRGVPPNTAFAPVVISPRVLAAHPPGLTIPDLRQLQQQNHRLMGSAPNLLPFIPPHVMLQTQQAGNKTLGHQGFPSENGMLRPIHQIRNNMGFRHTFQNPLVDQHRMPLPGQYSLRPDRVMGPHFVNNRTAGGNFNQHHGHRNNYNSHYSNHNHRHHQHHLENGSVDQDEYAGLMTSREKHWLQNIQSIQLNTSQPYIDDYYFTVFASRQSKENNNKQIEDRHRERRDSHRDRERPDQQCSSKVYTPAQFENSLGKLQVGSVTAPRKIIDMDIVSTEGLDSTLQSVQRDSRKFKQLLLEVERLYLILLQIEDLTSTVPEVKASVAEERPNLLHKIVTSLVTDDRLTSIMCVQKGRNLLLRVLPHISTETEREDNPMLYIWSTIFRSLVTIGKRDQASEVSLLPRFYPYFKSWLNQSKFARIMEVANSMVPSSLDSSRTTSPITPVIPAKNVLVYALGNKFGISSLVAMMERVDTLYSALEEKQCHEWSTFIKNLVEAVGLLASPNSLPTPIEPIDATVLNQHLGRCSTLCIEKYPVLENIFTGHHKIDQENKENKVIS
ncbi:hypothetical protein L9F63_009567 [Diploptera punctata]|uniref:Uncharacterized protein n=1 Tax=Diploptera punctata TaxID=6984 RepID=A0AAD8AJE9_DIPPU|nr:hypothetical protein L9F63_009567 [Diploptera punctata]